MDFPNATDEELVKIAHVDRRASAELDRRLKVELRRASEESVKYATVMTRLTRQLVRLTWGLTGLTAAAVLVAVWR